MHKNTNYIVETDLQYRLKQQSVERKKKEGNRVLFGCCDRKFVKSVRT